jgi:hypothetical protein
MNGRMTKKAPPVNHLDRIKDPKMRAAAESSLKRHRKALDMLAKL